MRKLNLTDVKFNLKKDKININNNYSEFYLIYDYPGLLGPGFLYGLQQGSFVGEQKDGRTDITISLIVRPAELHFDRNRKMQMDRLQQDINAATSAGKASDFADPKKIAALETLQELRNGRNNFVELYFLISINSTNEKILKNSCKSFERALNSFGTADNFSFKKLKYQQYLGLQGSSIIGDSERILKKYKGRIMGVDSLAAFYPFLSGNFSDEDGVYIGHRIDSAMAVNLNFKKSADAQNMLVTGETGEGKSQFIKGLVLGLLSAGYRVYIYDLDGEFRDICEAYGGVWIDLTGEDAPFVDPTIIQEEIMKSADLSKLTKSDVMKIKEEDNKRKKNAGEETISLLSLICGAIKWKEDPRINNAAQLSLMNMWEDEGITECESSWNNGSPSLHKLYEKIKENASDKNFIFQSGATKLYNMLWPFFEGLDRGTFSKTIDSKAFQEKKLIVMRTEAAGENPSPKKKRDAALKFNMASAMVWNQIIRDRLLKIQISAEIFEEFQRAGNDESVYRAVYRGITTSRKFHSMVTIGFNDPSVLFGERTDSEGNKVSNKGLWINARHLVAFRLPKDTIDNIAEDSGMPEEIINFWRTLPKYSCLFRTRLGNNQTAYEVLKMMLPKEELELSKTREFVS